MKERTPAEVLAELDGRMNVQPGTYERAIDTLNDLAGGLSGDDTDAVTWAVRAIDTLARDVAHLDAVVARHQRAVGVVDLEERDERRGDRDELRRLGERLIELSRRPRRATK